MKKGLAFLASLALALLISLPASAADTVEIKSAVGVTVCPVNPKRVVCMDYGLLDTIDYLVANKILKEEPTLAISKNSLPAYLAQYKDEKYLNLGGLKDFNIEAIAAFKPDVILLSGRQVKFVDTLKEIAPVVMINSQPNPYWEGCLENITEMGKLFGVEKEMAAVIAELEAEAAAVRAKAEKNPVKALIVMTNDGKISVYGSGSRFGIIHDKLGVGQIDENIQIGKHGQSVNYEYISEKNPDALLVVDRSVAVGKKAAGGAVLDNELVNGTKAVKNGKLIALDAAVWYLSGGGIESLKIQMAEVAKAVE